jgi:hypothetical protein
MGSRFDNSIYWILSRVVTTIRYYTSTITVSVNFWTALNDVLLTNPIEVVVILRVTVCQSMTRYLLLFYSYDLTLWCALSDENICLLYMLMVLASAVFLGSESLGTRGHTLLSQIRHFPFYRLLRLVGSRWRYSTPQNCFLYRVDTDHIKNTASIVDETCLLLVA